jgi:hypothetical protein
MTACPKSPLFRRCPQLRNTGDQTFSSYFSVCCHRKKVYVDSRHIRIGISPVSIGTIRDAWIGWRLHSVSRKETEAFLASGLPDTRPHDGHHFTAQNEKRAGCVKHFRAGRLACLRRSAPCGSNGTRVFSARALSIMPVPYCDRIC